MITMQKLSAAVIAAALICTNLPVSDASETITARQVVQRIQQRVAVAWRDKTNDTFKVGDPDTAVTGITVTRNRLAPLATVAYPIGVANRKVFN